MQKQRSFIFSSKISKAVITVLLCVLLCFFLNTVIFAEDLTQDVAFVKIYRYVQSLDSYTWVNTEFEIDDVGNITTADDHNAFQREMLDFIFPAKTVSDVTFSYTVKVVAPSNPTVTSTAGSMRLRFDGTNVSTKTVRGAYKVQSGTCIYQVNTVRYEFETPITIDEIDITSYITSVSAEISFQDVKLIINDEEFKITQDLDEYHRMVESRIAELNGVVSDYDSQLQDVIDEITVDDEYIFAWDSFADDFNVRFNLGIVFNIFDHPMFQIISTLLPLLMIASYLLFGRGG